MGRRKGSIHITDVKMLKGGATKKEEMKKFHRFARRAATKPPFSCGRL